jgi:hypothetical protein
MTKLSTICRHACRCSPVVYMWAVMHVLGAFHWTPELVLTLIPMAVLVEAARRSE